MGETYDVLMGEKRADSPMKESNEIEKRTFYASVERKKGAAGYLDFDYEIERDTNRLRLYFRDPRAKDKWAHMLSISIALLENEYKGNEAEWFVDVDGSDFLNVTK
jgi:hypothetical protein